ATGINTQLVVTKGLGDFGGEPLAKNSPASIEIDTGVAQFIVRKRRFNLLDHVVMGGRELVKSEASGGLVIMGPAGGQTDCGLCKTAYSSSNDATSTAEIEENGPVRAVVKAMGAHKDVKGNIYMRFTVRMTFYKGKAYVKITSILRNADNST